jgi:hypothetical protein
LESAGIPLTELSRIGQGLTDRFNVNTASFPTANRNATAVNGTFQRIPKGGRANEMYELTGNKAHFTQPRSDSICTRDADDVSSLAGLELVECGVHLYFLNENQSQ